MSRIVTIDAFKVTNSGFPNSITTINKYRPLYSKVGDILLIHDVYNVFKNTLSHKHELNIANGIFIAKAASINIRCDSDSILGDISWSNEALVYSEKIVGRIIEYEIVFDVVEHIKNNEIEIISILRIGPTIRLLPESSILVK